MARNRSTISLIAESKTLISDSMAMSLLYILRFPRLLKSAKFSKKMENLKDP